jgi:molybdopterin-containing oxidoreductase family membrane subunit
VILGGLAQVYVIIIGGQAYPLVIFPGKEVASSFFDGVVAAYAPSLPEVALGAGGMALALILTAVALKVLPLLPRSLADSEAAAGRAAGAGQEQAALP